MKAGNIDLIYSIDEGKRYTINKISTNVDKVFDKKLFFPLKKVIKNILVIIILHLKVKKY